MQVHAGGMMQCCAVAPDTDIGDFLLDYCDKIKNHEDCDPFNNEGLQLIREGILTGNLRPMCRKCFFVKNELITTNELRKRLIEYLYKRYPDLDLENIDLRKVHAYWWMAISFTNRCNLNCVYCVQSVHKNTNPYFKMEFPYEYAEMTLDYFASQGIEKFSTCVEGEATLYRYWYELFSKFVDKYPHIKLRMTTNLNKKYTDDEIELLTKYRVLDVSIDSLDPALYAQLRVGGNLDVLLENLDKIDARVKTLGIKGPYITLHPVLSSLSWRSFESLSEFAFSRGYGIEGGNYEERSNTIAYQKNMLVPISRLSKEEQAEIYRTVEKLRLKFKQKGLKFGLQGELFTNIRAAAVRNYNYFTPYDDNPVFSSFYKKYPKGLENQYLDIVYDIDNISHEGIILLPGAVLELEDLHGVESLIVREIHVYKPGTVSSRYGQNVLLRYRKKVTTKDGQFYYKPEYPNENVAKLLLEICEYNSR
jgi:hypothetical protein